jgi:hypothetical protein
MPIWAAALGLTGVASGAEPPQARVQRIGEAIYFHVRLEPPPGFATPSSFRRSVDNIALHDLGRRPCLIPQDDHTHAVVWRWTTGAQGLEFLGRCREPAEAQLLLLAPVQSMETDKPGWAERAVIIDLTRCETLPARAARTAAEVPGVSDLDGQWATAQALDWAAREHLAGGAELFRFARQSLCRRFHVADPLPAPPALPRTKPSSERSIALPRVPEIESSDRSWQRSLLVKNPPVEELARFVPNDFYYLRFRDVKDAPERIQRWAGVASALINGAGREFRFIQQYQKQLAFPLTSGGRPRWPSHIREFALIGSDLHLHTGTDFTVLFVVDDLQRFRTEADEAIRAVRKHHSLEERRSEDGGIVIESFQTADRSISLYRTFLGNVAIFSNSSIALQRVLDAQAKQIPSLAEAPDFRLMRTSLDPAAPGEQILAYASDAFERRQLSPARFVKAKRRADELAVLKALQYSTIHSRLESGRPAADLAALGQAAGFAPGDPRLGEAKFSWDQERQQVRSAVWNTIEFATPLIEIPLDRVTAEEETAYRTFLEEVKANMFPYLTPVGVRFQVNGGKIEADIFAMPQERATAWDWLRKRVGRATVERPEPATNVPARLTSAFVSDPTDQARLQEALIQAGVDKKYFRPHAEWLGDRIAAQLDDGPGLASLAEYLLGVDLTAEDHARPRGPRELRYLLVRLPLSAALEIRRPVVFLGWLTQTRKALTESFPKLFTWEMQQGGYRTIKLTRIQLNQAVTFVLFGKLVKPEEAPALWYAFNNRVLLMSLHETAMKNGVSRELLPRERPRRPGERFNAALDLNLSASPELQKSLETYLVHESHRQALAAATLWQTLFQARAVSPMESPRAREEAAERWLGFVPAPVDGSEWRFEAKTGDVQNARHGSVREPRLPQRLEKDTPLASLLEELRLFHADLSIRDDGFLLHLTIMR